MALSFETAKVIDIQQLLTYVFVRLADALGSAATNMTSENDPDIDMIMGDADMDPSILSFQASAIVAVCAAVLIGNLFVFALNCFRLHNNKLYHRVIMFATVMNLVSAIVCMPLMAAALLEGEWKYGYSLCKITGLLCFVSMAFTMTLTALASVCKIVLFLRLHFGRMIFGVFLHKDFIVTSIVFLFTLVSQAVLFLLVYSSRLWTAPLAGLCKYANSPGLTGYRMFYLVYSTLLTLAALILVVPFEDENSKL